jgi:hypothetical protein
MVKDDNMEVKMSAGKAAGRLVAAELQQSGSSASLPSTVSLLVALLGRDQHSEVQKQALGVLRKLAAVGAPALEQFYPDLIPSVLSMIQDSSGSTKLAAERTVARVLQLDKGPEAMESYLKSGKPGALAKQMLTETYCRRLSKLPATELEDDLAAYAI